MKASFRKLFLPTREYVKAQGIAPGAEDQILRTIKKVTKAQIQPEEAIAEASKYFAQQGINFEPEHINIIDNALQYMQNLPEYEAAMLDSMLIAELQEEQRRIEEQDIVFVIMQMVA